jgi:hypothetical protein
MKKYISYFLLAFVFIFSNLFTSAQAPNAGLIGQYNFHNGYSDSSTLNNHATNYGSIADFDRCAHATAINLNGTSQYVDLTKQDSLAYNLNEFTISILFKSSGGKTDWETLIGTVNNPGTGTSFSIDINRSSIGFDLGTIVSILRDKNGNSITMAMRDTSINNGDWHQYCIVVKNSSQNLYDIYLDGSKVVPLLGYTANNPASFNLFDHNLLLGAANNRGTTSRFYNGALDDVFMYSRALDSNEVLDIYNDSCSNTASINKLIKDGSYSFDVSPNPASDVITITSIGFNDYTNTEASIWNTVGQKIETFNIESKTSLHHINHLESGTYIIKITNSNKNVMQVLKFFVQ